jgi:hypothetical protein
MWMILMKLVPWVDVEEMLNSPIFDEDPPDDDIPLTWKTKKIFYRKWECHWKKYYSGILYLLRSHTINWGIQTYENK